MGYVTRISRIFGPNYPEISDGQFNSHRTLSLNNLREIKRLLAKKKKTTAINIDFFRRRAETTWNV